MDPAQNAAFRFVNRALAGGGSVRVQGGRYAVSGVATATLDGWANSLGLRVERTAGTDATSAEARPRIALYRALAPSMDEGWTEWLLDQHEFRYTVISDADVRVGDLNARFDVILFASDRAGTLTNGYAPGRVPPAIEGGLGDAGVRALDAFVQAGGTVVALNQSALFAIDAFHLKVRNVVRGLASKDFFASGSILEVTTDPAHPVMAGMPARAKVFFDGSPAFTTTDGFDGVALARYQKEGSPLLSGYLLGEKYLQGAAAALDVKHGRGHVVLIGFRPQWRGQTVGTFRVVLNSALYGPHVAEKAKPTSGFWTAPSVPNAPRAASDSTRRAAP